MRILASFLAMTLPLAATAAAGEEPSPGAATLGWSKNHDASISKKCGSGSDVAAYRKKPKLRAEPLGEQPPAALLYALHRTVDGCPSPIVLRKGIGAHPDRQLPLDGGARPQPLQP